MQIGKSTPTTPWNYGVLIDNPDRPDQSFSTAATQTPSSMPFDPDAAPVVLTARVRRISNWGLVDNLAGDIDGGPHPSQEPLEEVVLIRYGSTNLRIAAFPRVSD